MRMVCANRQLHIVLLLLASFAVCLTSVAAERDSSRKANVKKADSLAFFSAMQTGQIEVQFIPKNSKQATLLIRNNTKKPLAIQMPPVFAGIPALRQFGGGGMGGGMFNLPPEKVRKLRMPTVCLEHGKKEPSPRVKYLIVPIEMFTQNPEVIELGRMLSTGKLDQAAAQAAVWHHTDGLTWNQLANKVGIEHLDGSKEPYFQFHQLNTAVRLSAIAQWRVRNLAALQQTAAKSKGSLRDE